MGRMSQLGPLASLKGLLLWVIEVGAVLGLPPGG